MGSAILASISVTEQNKGLESDLIEATSDYEDTQYKLFYLNE